MKITIWHYAAVIGGVLLWQANLWAVVKWAHDPRPPRLYWWQLAAAAGATLVLPLIVLADWLSGAWSGLFFWYLAGELAYPALIFMIVVPLYVRPARERNGWLSPRDGSTGR